VSTKMSGEGSGMVYGRGDSGQWTVEWSSVLTRGVLPTAPTKPSTSRAKPRDEVA
jgi:hypothetical protein